MLNAVGDLLSLAGIVVMMLVLDLRLSLIAFAALPVVGLIVELRQEKVPRGLPRHPHEDRAPQRVPERASQRHRVVQAYAREAAMAEEFDGINEAYRDANKRSIFYEALLDAAIEMVGILCIASVLFWTGFHRLGAHVVTFATVVTFTQYIKQFFEPVSILATALHRAPERDGGSRAHLPAARRDRASTRPCGPKDECASRRAGGRGRRASRT